MTAADENDASPSASAKAATRAASKLPPIPNGAKIQKRPLIRRQLPSSSKTPVIYVSSSTPFMSAVKRVQKHLDKSLRNATAAAPKNASLHSRVEALRRRGADADSGTSATAVTVMGTGKAVQKTLSLASWFEQKADCAVEIKTATVGTVDDVLVEGLEGDDESRVRRLSCLEVVVRLK
ncbi:rpp20 subunit of nuclear RNase MRP and P domain-containing protein [Hirsutella rhossiliensis]|uniref:Rpp20 subunit of nuclear RNase MRP and P domain-containing protein n=1 Tax=Hirsutella rhossiliensis TaxID=111463 RepID=A0A9P8SD95_9HYPO|nr:rpp20 subunit of nuclear RNase MRP and P domain-containing protein [Hirsutella rhossiliensis]KAH0958366.1 rpp20 subunit of nuclear RNase MRP and P domain-containing protein [Hirsutella rhossiliensis]